jgi:4'-phosphopantetheinyl transferase
MPADSAGEMKPSATAGGGSGTWSVLDIRLWQVDLDRALLEHDGSVIPTCERERASRFAFEHLRRRYLASRVFMREVLARDLGCRPGEIEFGAGPQGKPFVCGAEALHFSLSHSEQIAVLAIAPGEVGVDVEVVRTLEDSSALAERLFVPRELVWLEAASEVERDQRFFTCWTRKEASIKAVGAGLSIDPATFDAGVGEAAARTVIEWNAQPITVLIHGSAMISNWVYSLATVSDLCTGAR